MRRNQSELAGLIKLDSEFIDQLLARKFISERQQKAILKDMSAKEQNKKFLEIMRHRSLAAFDMFARHLEKTKQYEVMNLLQTSAGELLFFGSFERRTEFFFIF